MPKEDKLPEPTPELMRLRIISVAALNWGTYFGGDSIADVSTVLVATDVLELGWCGASIVNEVDYLEIDTNLRGARMKAPQVPRRTLLAAQNSGLSASYKSL